MQNRALLVQTYLVYEVAFHIRVELLKQLSRVLCTKSPNRLVIQKEVDAQVCFGDNRRVQDGKIPDACRHP